MWTQIKQKGVQPCSKPNRRQNPQAYPVGIQEKLFLYTLHILLMCSFNIIRSYKYSKQQ